MYIYNGRSKYRTQPHLRSSVVSIGGREGRSAFSFCLGRVRVRQVVVRRLSVLYSRPRGELPQAVIT